MPKINELEWNTALAFANVDVDQVAKADTNSIFKLTQEIEALVKENNASLAKFKIKEIGHLKDRTAVLNMVKMYLSTVKQGLPSLKKFTEKELNEQLIVAMQSIVLASRSLPCEKIHPVVKLIGSAYGKKFVDQALRLPPSDQAGGKDTDSKEPLTKADEQLRFLLFQNKLTPERVDLEYNKIRMRVMKIPRQQVPAPVPVASGPSGACPLDSLMPSGGGCGEAPGGGGNLNFGDGMPSLLPIPVSNDDFAVTCFPPAKDNMDDPYPTRDICQIDDKPDAFIPGAANPDSSANDKPLSMDSSIQDMLKKLNSY